MKKHIEKLRVRKGQGKPARIIGCIFPIVVFLVLVNNSYALAQQQSDKVFRGKAAQLEKEGKFLEAAQMYAKAAEAKKAMNEKTKYSFLGIEISIADYQAVVGDLSKAGYLCYQVGHYEKSIEFYLKTFAVLKKASMENDFAGVNFSIGQSYFKLGKYNEAFKYYTDAIASAKKTGQEYFAAGIMNSTGQAYESLTQYIKAAEHYEKAKDIFKKLGKENDYANMLNNSSMAYLYQGKYDKAIKNLQEAFTIHKKLGMEREASVNLNNIGLVYYAWSQYDKALKYFEEAFSSHRKLGLDSEIPTTLRNIGNVYLSWGQYNKAMGYYDEALDLSRKSGDEKGIADGLAAIGELYYSSIQGDQYDRAVKSIEKALKYFEEALLINKKLGREAYVAGNLNNIAKIQLWRQQYDKALVNFNEALAIVNKLGIAETYCGTIDGIGQIYFHQGQYGKAIKMFEDSIKMAKKIGNESATSVSLFNIGRTYYELKNYKIAAKSFLESVNIIEKLRKTAAGATRRDYIARQIAMYQYLTSAYVREKDFPKAFNTIELSRAKFLAEQIASSEKDILIPSLNEIQQTLSGDSAIIMYANMNLNNKVMMVVTKDEAYGIEFSNFDLYDSKWTNYIEETNSELEKQRGLKIVDRNKAQETAFEIKPACSCEAIINYYRVLLIASGQESRGLAIRKRQHDKTSDDEIKELAKLLYNIFVKPLEEKLKGKTNLLIITDGPLGFMPLETLIDESGRYMVEKYHISYVQSMGVMDLIKKRRYEDNRKPLLAFGGAVYEISKTGITRSSKQTSAIGTTVYSLISKGSVRGAYDSMGMGIWKNLPHSLSEVKAIADIVKGTELYTGDKVSESNVKRLSSTGELSKYKVIHFATHGMVIPAFPEFSALVLSQHTDGQDDGYLRMEEISKLKLKADFVNLSACDTGLGKLYEGEGVVGLAQAFLIAGANGLSVSLWQVADDSTSIFMSGMYELSNHKGWSYARAITEMKRRFIKGDFGAGYKSPYFWAPFVYYGK